jgi:Contractile injection system tube protein
MGYSGSLEKMTITAYEKDDFKTSAGKFSAYINPATYSHRYQISYNNVQAQGSSKAAWTYSKTCAEEVAFELVFDGTGVIPSPIPGLVPFTANGVVKQIKEFRDLVFKYSSRIHSPKFVQLAWGTLLFNCRLESLTINYTLFKPDGTPLRARANCSFVGFTSELQAQLEARMSSPDVSHVLTVKAGDTLPLMCYRIYGSSSYYAEVARVNGLTDFRRLMVGSRLLFPPLAEATP